MGVAGKGLGPTSSAAPALAPQAAAEPAPMAGLSAMPQTFTELIALCDERREGLLSAQLSSHVHLVAYEPGRIEFRPDEAAPRDLANRLGQLLGEWTGQRWIVAVSQAAGMPTVAEQQAARENALRNEVTTHPLVRAVLDTFPGATIAAVRERFAAEASELADDAGDEIPGAEEDDP